MRERALFLTLVLLALVPVWAVEYLPTTDGPCHTYNAWALRQYDSPRYPLFREYYEIHWRPVPNWLAQGVMAGLMFPFEPRTAEKLLVSGYLVLFLAGARLLAGAVDRERRWLGLLAFPLAFNQLFQMGFYNFSLGLALWMVVVGWWWRRRGGPAAGFALGLNLLLLLLYFAHIVPFALALAAIGVLWLCTLRRATWKRHLLQVAMLAPQVVLPLWFLASSEGRIIPARTSFAAAFRHLAQLHVLVAFGRPQLWLGRLLAGLFLLLLVLTLWRRLRGRPGGPRSALGEADGFLLLAGLTTVLYFLAPEGLDLGALLKQRLSLFPWLLLLPWLSPSLSKGLRRALLGGLALLLLGYVAYLVDRYRAVDGEIRRLLRAAEPIAPNTRMLPLLFDKGSDHAELPLLGHAVAYVAADKGLIDWDNYEAASENFSLRFRRAVLEPNIYAIEADPGGLNLLRYLPWADYVFCWKMPEGAPVARQLRRHYRLLAEHGPARLFERRDRTAQPAEGPGPP